MGIVVDRYRIDADREPTSCFDTDPDSDLDPDHNISYTQLGKSEIFCFYSQQCKF